MVTILTLFVGLVAGMQHIEVAVSPEVARVEIHLDGLLLGTLDGSPWALRADLGQELEPRELVVTAFDAEGLHVATDRLWINLPQRRADARLVPLLDRDGRLETVRLVWDSPEFGHPTGVEVRLDGRLVSGGQSSRIDVSGLDRGATHILQARLRFSENLVLERELVFGSGRMVSLGSDLTSVAVDLHRRRELPPVEQMQAWFVRDGAPLEVSAWEKGPAQVVVLVDLGIPETFRHYYARYREPIVGGSASWRLRRQGEPEEASVCTLDPETTARLMSPVPVAMEDRTRPTDVFPCTDGIPAHRVGLYAAVTRSTAPGEANHRRLADAVAVAAMAAVEDNRRRAVVLLLGAELRDRSRHSPAAARQYLQDLHVPLHVWDMSDNKKQARASWGQALRVDYFADIEAGVRLLSYLLQDQRIVWVKGTHPPQAIALGPGARGIRLAGGGDR